MTKGKYAARAANRLAADKDAELRQAHAATAAVRAELAAALAELEQERRDRGALIVQRADDQSRKLIETAHRDALKLKEQHAEDKRRVADIAAERFIQADSIPRWWITEALPILIPDPGERTRYFNEHLTPDLTPSREARRHGARNVNRQSRITEYSDVKAIAIERLVKQPDEQET